MMKWDTDYAARSTFQTWFTTRSFTWDPDEDPACALCETQVFWFNSCDPMLSAWQLIPQDFYAANNETNA